MSDRCVPGHGREVFSLHNNNTPPTARNATLGVKHPSAGGVDPGDSHATLAPAPAPILHPRREKPLTQTQPQGGDRIPATLQRRCCRKGPSRSGTREKSPHPCQPLHLHDAPSYKPTKQNSHLLGTHRPLAQPLRSHTRLWHQSCLQHSPRLAANPCSDQHQPRRDRPVGRTWGLSSFQHRISPDWSLGTQFHFICHAPASAHNGTNPATGWAGFAEQDSGGPGQTGAAPGASISSGQFLALTLHGKTVQRPLPPLAGPAQAAWHGHPGQDRDRQRDASTRGHPLPCPTTLPGQEALTTLPDSAGHRQDLLHRPPHPCLWQQTRKAGCLHPAVCEDARVTGMLGAAMHLRNRREGGKRGHTDTQGLAGAGSGQNGNKTKTLMVSAAKLSLRAGKPASQTCQGLNTHTNVPRWESCVLAFLARDGSRSAVPGAAAEPSTSLRAAPRAPAPAFPKG